MAKDKLCKCGGENPDCKICEGTGIVLFDEKFDNIHDLYASDDRYYEEEVEDE